MNPLSPSRLALLLAGLATSLGLTAYYSWMALMFFNFPWLGGGVVVSVSTLCLAAFAWSRATNATTALFLLWCLIPVAVHFHFVREERRYEFLQQHPYAQRDGLGYESKRLNAR